MRIEQTDIHHLMLGHWSRAAAHLGIQAEGATLRPLTVTQRAKGLRAVIRIECASGEVFVLKYDGLAGPESFAKAMAKHRALANCFVGRNEFSTPDLLYCDESQRVALFPFVTGGSVFSSMKKRRRPQAMLRRIGALARTIHEGKDTALKPFGVPHIVEHVKSALARIETCDSPFAEPERLAALGRVILKKFRPVARQCQSPFGLRHGDFHLRNLLWLKGHLCVLDASDVQPGFQMRDLANFWVRYGYIKTAEAQETAGFAGMPMSHYDAFAEGYGQTFESDPVFRFFFALQIFEDWSLARNLDRSTGKQVPARNLKRHHCRIRLSEAIASE